MLVHIWRQRVTRVQSRLYMSAIRCCLVKSSKEGNKMYMQTMNAKELRSPQETLC